MSDVLSVAAAVEGALLAKAAYRDDPSDETKAAHRLAARELRYRRWLARGGPMQETARIEEQERKDAALRDAGFEPAPAKANGEVAEMYARWLAEGGEV